MNLNNIIDNVTLLYVLMLVMGYITLFKTPQSLVDLSFKTSVGKVRLRYIVNYSTDNLKSNILDYSFDHGFYDGDLMNKYLVSSTFVPKRYIATPLRLYEDYQIINYVKTHEQYSSFTLAVGTLLRKMCTYYQEKYPNKKGLRVGVFVSKRDLLKCSNVKGNYIRFVNYSIDVTDSLEDICKTHHNAIAKEKANPRINTKAFEMISVYQNHIILNSHRNLSQIRRDDGNELFLFRKKQFENKDHMEHTLFSRSLLPKFVTLDYFDRNWIVSNCE